MYLHDTHMAHTIGTRYAPTYDTIDDIYDTTQHITFYGTFGYEIISIGHNTGHIFQVDFNLH